MKNNMNEILDYVLNLLFDDEKLHLESTEFLDVLGNKILHRSDLTIYEVNFALDLLTDEGYVRKSQDGKTAIKYSLTTKGVQIKLLGGFKEKVKIEKTKQKLIDWSLIAVIVAGVYYLLEIINILIKWFFK